MNATPTPTPPVEKPAAEPVRKPEPEERPPQQEELLCTICGMRSCWRE